MSRAKRLSYGLLLALLVSIVPVGATTRVASGQTEGEAPPCGTIVRNDTTGVPRWLEDCGSAGAARGRVTPEGLARNVLAGMAESLGLRPDGSDLNLLKVDQSGTDTVVRFEQVHDGVAVYSGQILVRLSDSGEVRLVNNHTVPNLDIDVTPQVDELTATATALAAVEGSDQLRSPLQQALVIYLDGATPKLAWRIIVPTFDPAGDWNVFISATSGEILAIWDQLARDSGTGLAYHPNPVQQSGDTGLADNGDATSAALDNARVALTLDNLNSGTFQLRGSYVDATGTGIEFCSLPYTPGTANEPTRTYNYTRDDDRFEEVTTYAAIDGVQTWFQSLGFTDANNRSIPVDVHCFSADNSFYSNLDEALHFGDGGVDDAEDADIVLHEYGHSVQSNQVPGWGPSIDTEQRAMGEGFGDFLAGIYYINTGDPTYLSNYRYCIGEWDAVSYNPVEGGNSGSGCLRWIDGRSEFDGADIGTYSGTPIEEHDDGRYWSATLTCVYEGMGADLAARDDIMSLVLEHHRSLTPDTSDNAFDDAVQALILADKTLFNGANVGQIASCALANLNIVAVSDAVAPTITLTTAAGDTLAPTGWYNIASSGTDGVLVNVAATDTSGVASLTCVDNGTTTVLNTTSSSGSFVLTAGVHSITCTATDTLGNSGAGPGSTAMPVVYQIDQTAPVLSNVPQNITAPVSPGKPTGIVIWTNPTSSDPVTCVPASGSTFNIGTTTVVCTATDLAGNQTSASFTVTIFGAEKPIRELVTLIQRVPIQGSAATVNSIRRTMLTMASMALILQDGKQNTLSCLLLKSLTREVQTQVSGRRITSANAALLYARINEARYLLGCK